MMIRTSSIWNWGNWPHKKGETMKFAGDQPLPQRPRSPEPLPAAAQQALRRAVQLWAFPAPQEPVQDGWQNVVWMQGLVTNQPASLPGFWKKTYRIYASWLDGRIIPKAWFPTIFPCKPMKWYDGLHLSRSFASYCKLNELGKGASLNESNQKRDMNHISNNISEPYFSQRSGWILIWIWCLLSMQDITKTPKHIIPHPVNPGWASYGHIFCFRTYGDFSWWFHVVNLNRGGAGDTIGSLTMTFFLDDVMGECG